jgi:hypothetical protein
MGRPNSLLLGRRAIVVALGEPTPPLHTLFSLFAADRACYGVSTHHCKLSSSLSSALSQYPCILFHSYAAVRACSGVSPHHFMSSTMLTDSSSKIQVLPVRSPAHTIVNSRCCSELSYSCQSQLFRALIQCQWPLLTALILLLSSCSELSYSCQLLLFRALIHFSQVLCNHNPLTLLTRPEFGPRDHLRGSLTEVDGEFDEGGLAGFEGIRKGDDEGLHRHALRLGHLTVSARQNSNF